MAITAIDAYELSYDPNLATSGTVPAPSILAYSATTTASVNSGTLARTGYAFAGWNTAADGSGTTYTAGSSTVTMPASNLVLYAKWSALPTPTPATPTPATTLPDLTPPTTKEQRVTNVKQPITLRGTATDAGSVRRVRVSVARHIGKLCRFLLADGKFSTARSCDKTSYLDAKGTSSWSLKLPVLPYGRYTIWTRGIDANGNVERKNHAQNLLVVRIPH